MTETTNIMPSMGDWDAASYFKKLTEESKLARAEGFAFGRCSGLEGFEDAINKMSRTNAMVLVSDVSDGYLELADAPKSRRIKTVFMFMRHAVGNMEARSRCMSVMRNLFKQYMSRLLKSRMDMQMQNLYFDPRIQFNEVEQYFFDGGACAYFQLAVDVYTDLRFNPDDWTT